MKKISKAWIAEGLERISDFPDCGEKRLVCYMIADQIWDELRINKSEAYAPMWFSSENCKFWLNSIGLNHSQVMDVFGKIERNNGNENSFDR